MNFSLSDNKSSNTDNVEMVENTIDKDTLKKVFWRSIPMEFTWNYERQMHLGYTYAMLPVLKKLYPNKEDLADAMTRHMEFYNTTPYIITLPLGISAAMEEKRVKNRESFDTDSIANVKTAMMGPLAGIGDSFYWGTLRILATGIGTSLALQGNILGPILFLLIYNIPGIVIRYMLTFLGYHLGTDILTKIEERGIMGLVSYGASIMGLTVAGAMTAEMVGINFTIPIGTGETATTLQEILEGIIPGLGALLLTGFVYWLLKKGMKPLALTFLLMGIAVLGAWMGFLG